MKRTGAKVEADRAADRGLAVIVHPPGAQHVSPRSAAQDLAGNGVEQTVIRAYALK